GGQGHVVGITAHAEAHQLGIDVRPTGLRVLVLFQHQYPGAVAQHEAVAVQVPGAAGGFRVVVAGGQGAGGGKAPHAQGRAGHFSAAGDHDVGVRVGDDARGLADIVGAGGAGGDDGDIGALHAIHDGQVPGNHVDDAAGDEKGRDLARPAL